jgi:hypothetical protein
MKLSGKSPYSGYWYCSVKSINIVYPGSNSGDPSKSAAIKTVDIAIVKAIETAFLLLGGEGAINTAGTTLSHSRAAESPFPL